jgi:hypothetical protein
MTPPGLAERTGADNCSGDGAVSCPRSSSSRDSLAFSARNRSTSRRRSANSSTGPSSRIGLRTLPDGVRYPPPMAPKWNALEALVEEATVDDEQLADLGRR